MSNKWQQFYKQMNGGVSPDSKIVQNSLLNSERALENVKNSQVGGPRGDEIAEQLFDKNKLDSIDTPLEVEENNRQVPKP